MEHAQNDRYTRGWNKLKEIDGATGERVIAALAPIAPDFGRLLIEFGFGDNSICVRGRLRRLLLWRRSVARSRS
jgi:hypothetical protein